MSAFEFPKKVEYQQSSLSETFFISNSSYESLTALWLRLDSGLESGGETCLSQRAWPQVATVKASRNLNSRFNTHESETLKRTLWFLVFSFLQFLAVSLRLIV